MNLKFESDRYTVQYLYTLTMYRFQDFRYQSLKWRQPDNYQNKQLGQSKTDNERYTRRQ